MGIRQKFFAMAGLIGLVMVVVSCIGYYTAYTNLNESVEKEILATVEVQGQSFDGWLREKAQAAASAASLFTTLDGKKDVSSMREMLSLGVHDKDILSLAAGDEDGFFMSWSSGNLTGKIDPRKRPWYVAAKTSGKLVFTDAYKDVTKNILVVSAAVPYKDQAGNFRGAICGDIALDVLQKRIADVNYRGAGKGMIIEKSGKILASSEASETMTEVTENDGLKDHFQEMQQQHQGYFLTKKDGESTVFAYTTVASTGWIVGVSVPESFVFAQIAKLKLTYVVLTIIGLALILFVSFKFSNQITQAIIRLKKHADALAGGNLRVEELPVTSNDELGALTAAFNTMSQNLRTLLQKLSAAAEHVAASSEELTASSQQSAEASNHVAATVSKVADGMEDQMKNIDGTKSEVDRVCVDISSVADKMTSITETSQKTANAAQQGEHLMNTAMAGMGTIEEKVLHSANVVQELGENSQQIGEIIKSIGAIADQTNLLALNAAIEAARAGEHGRGFAVVAEEVRKLASESQNSAEEIKKRIASIQEDTKNAVLSMQSGTDEVKNGAKSIRDVGTQFASIMDMVKNMNAALDAIQSSVQAVSGGAHRIVSAVHSIDDVSRETSEHTQTISAATQEQSASTEEIASASQALAQMAMELQEETGKFKI